MNKTFHIVSSVLLLSLSSLTFAQNKDADNTGRNERDRAKEAVTPEKQSNKPEHLKVTQDIRKAVMGDKSLSATAKNVKIITTEHGVTLRGVVQSADERRTIADLAKKSAGALKVDDQLEIKQAK
jgi:hyperosmotically inducible periplasmic protein